MRLFLDTSVLVSIISERTEEAQSLWKSHSGELVVNEYVMKELRRILQTRLGNNDYVVNLTVERVERRCTVVPDPSNNEFRKIRITDKSDRPIVCSALQHECVLVTEDRLLLKEAPRYVRAMRPEDVAPD